MMEVGKLCETRDLEITNRRECMAAARELQKCPYEYQGRNPCLDFDQKFEVVNEQEGFPACYYRDVPDMFYFNLNSNTERKDIDPFTAAICRVKGSFTLNIFMYVNIHILLSASLF